MSKHPYGCKCTGCRLRANEQVKPAPIKLWLDDERPAPEGWEWAKSVADAMVLCQSRTIEAMSLDHDLGSGRPTGYDFCCWIEREVAAGRFVLPTRISIHSQNPAGKAAMKLALVSARRFTAKGEQS